jgi:hypothetical protein
MWCWAAEVHQELLVDQLWHFLGGCFYGIPCFVSNDKFAAICAAKLGDVTFYEFAGGDNQFGLEGDNLNHPFVDPAFDQKDILIFGRVHEAHIRDVVRGSNDLTEIQNGLLDHGEMHQARAQTVYLPGKQNLLGKSEFFGAAGDFCEALALRRPGVHIFWLEQDDVTVAEVSVDFL